MYKDVNCIISKSKKPCIVCGKLTNRLEKHYEAYICSSECEEVMDKEVAKYETMEGRND